MSHLKTGAAAVELHPMLRAFMLVAAEEHYRITGTPIIFTALQNGRHSDRSFHYGTEVQGRKKKEYDDRCRAVDIRTHNPMNDEEILDSGNRSLFINRCKKRMHDFDILYEPNPAHIHAEYDPKVVP